MPVDHKKRLREAYNKAVDALQKNKGSHVYAACLVLLDSYAEKIKEDALSSDSSEKDLYAVKKLRELMATLERDNSGLAVEQDK